MKLVAVGGHSRNIGKTSLACSLIAAAPELDWTAVKIAQFGHGRCSVDGQPCGCEVEDPVHPFTIDEETAANAHDDTGRMLAAGARRALWVRAPQGRLSEAMPAFEQAVAGDSYVIVESNSLLDFLTPDYYVVTLDYRVEDFKQSCRRHLARADAFAVVESGSRPWSWFDGNLLEEKPVFSVAPPSYSSRALEQDALARISIPPGGARLRAAGVNNARVTSR